MLESNRPLHETSGSGPGGLGDVFSAPASAGLVTCSNGPYVERLPVANLTVGQIRARFGDLLDIDPQSTAVVDGAAAGNDTVVRAGQQLMFTRKAGEKGSNPRVTP